MFKNIQLSKFEDLIGFIQQFFYQAASCLKVEEDPLYEMEGFIGRKEGPLGMRESWWGLAEATTL